MAQFLSGTDPRGLEYRVPEARKEAERIAIAASCRDADDIPKVRDAGIVLTEPDGSQLQVMHNGLRVVADGYYGAWMTRLIQHCRGHHEPQEERAFYEMVNRLANDATMLELGGYWAYYTCWFLRGASERRAWVVEPDPAHLDIGRRNAAINGVFPTFLQGYVGAKPAPPTRFATESSGTIELPCLAVPQILKIRVSNTWIYCIAMCRGQSSMYWIFAMIFWWADGLMRLYLHSCPSDQRRSAHPSALPGAGGERRRDCDRGARRARKL